MKRLIFSVLFFVSFITGFAQQEAGSLTIQPKVGINLANYRGDDFIDKGESTGGGSPRARRKRRGSRSGLVR